jgi:hypothetical protein
MHIPYMTFDLTHFLKTEMGYNAPSCTFIFRPETSNAEKVNKMGQGLYLLSFQWTLMMINNRDK